jgi:hypothetical protein
MNGEETADDLLVVYLHIVSLAMYRTGTSSAENSPVQQTCRYERRARSRSQQPYSKAESSIASSYITSNNATISQITSCAQLMQSAFATVAAVRLSEPSAVVSRG